MAKAIPSLPASLPAIKQAGAAILALIHSRPSSPRPDEIEAIITQAVGGDRVPGIPATSPELSADHLEYRKIVAEVRKFDDGCPSGMTEEEFEARLEALGE